MLFTVTRKLKFTTVRETMGKDTKTLNLNKVGVCKISISIITENLKYFKRNYYDRLYIIKYYYSSKTKMFYLDIKLPRVKGSL